MVAAAKGAISQIVVVRSTKESSTSGLRSLDRLRELLRSCIVRRKCSQALEADELPTVSGITLTFISATG